MKRLTAVVVVGLALALPASAAAYTLSVSRAKIELLRLMREDYTPARGMGWYCKPRSQYWVQCGMAWRNVGGSRWYCGYGSVRYREGTFIATYRTSPCHP